MVKNHFLPFWIVELFELVLPLSAHFAFASACAFASEVFFNFPPSRASFYCPEPLFFLIPSGYGWYQLPLPKPGLLLLRCCNGFLLHDCRLDDCFIQWHWFHCWPFFLSHPKESWTIMIEIPFFRLMSLDAPRGEIRWIAFTITVVPVFILCRFMNFW